MAVALACRSRPRACRSASMGEMTDDSDAVMAALASAMRWVSVVAVEEDGGELVVEGVLWCWVSVDEGISVSLRLVSCWWAAELDDEASDGSIFLSYLRPILKMSSFHILDMKLFRDALKLGGYSRLNVTEAEAKRAIPLLQG
jgi:hypothetical protein